MSKKTTFTLLGCLSLLGLSTGFYLQGLQGDISTSPQGEITALTSSSTSQVALAADRDVAFNVIYEKYSPAPEETLVYESDSFTFYFRDDRDLFTVVNKTTNAVMKTGIDSYLGTDDVPDDEPVVETGLNSTFTGIANSLLYLEYFDGDTIKRTSSAGTKDSSSTFSMTGEDSGALVVDFTALDIQIIVDIRFDEDTITYDIPFGNLSGDGLMNIAAIILSPFVGASGGMEEHYNEELEDYDEAIQRPLETGYLFVPDGSGSLISFQDTQIAFSEYSSKVYGTDPSMASYANANTSLVVDMANPTLPVFGVAHTEAERGFVAYADSGAEYMNIVARPKENMNIKYYWVYPRFEYNSSYYQVYNQKGEGYFTKYENLNEFDISVSYSFLYGEDADYVGMATRYREHLIENGTLTPLDSVDNDIPIRLDFIMNDSKSSIVGTTQVNVTTADDVSEILGDFLSLGISNINSGLIGWQSKGETLAEPGDYKFSMASGSKSEIEDLIQDFANQGVDISLSNDYVTINKKSSSFLSVAAEHLNSLYPTVDKSISLPDNVPVSEFSFAEPSIAAQWLSSIDSKTNSQSLTVDGISNVLHSSYKNGNFTALDTVALYQNTLDQMDTTLNMVAPNLYLWEYTDRFLQAPVTDSKYIFETETVPFLQLVLHNTMEVYAPYANFSFYTQEAILTMIDYNVFPSFILSKESSHLLQDTHSAGLYSTESQLYQPLVLEIYEVINEVLSPVAGETWIDRESLATGVFVNHYSDGGEILINYTDSPYVYQGHSVPAMTAEYLG
ncbi:MAG: DUF5696 domain-containing protein [Eubacteriales bacterium]